jgi:hypothetical protein
MQMPYYQSQTNQLLNQIQQLLYQNM